MNSSSWSSYNPVKVISGTNFFDTFSSFFPVTGNVLLVTSAGFCARGMVERVRKQCGDASLFVCDQITPNPELDALDEIIGDYQDKAINCIIAIGGGSVLDAAKIFSVALTCEIDKPLNALLREDRLVEWQNKLPLLVVPTTSGTGAEVTPFATVWDNVTHKKYSLSAQNVFPTSALMDPSLTLTLPLSDTLNTALDAISHALESLWNKSRTPASEAFAVKSLNLIVKTLPSLLVELGNIQLRTTMQEASLYAGLAISTTRTAIAHSISYPITSYFNVPHGLACSFTLVSIIEHYFLQSATDDNIELMKDVRKLLISLDIETKMKKYINSEISDSIYGQMYSPGRADNFIFNVSLSDIKRLVENSLSLNEVAMGNLV